MDVCYLPFEFLIWHAEESWFTDWLTRVLQEFRALAVKSVHASTYRASISSICLHGEKILE